MPCQCHLSHLHAAVSPARVVKADVEENERLLTTKFIVVLNSMNFLDGLG